MDIGLVVVVVLAFGFAFSNGFHDASNAIATSVSTRALTPRIALAMAAVANLIGAFFGAHVAMTVADSIIAIPGATAGVRVCASALFGALTWNLVTWWRGLPSSSTHALVGGLVAAALAADTSVRWTDISGSIILPMVLSPVLGFAAAMALYAMLAHLVRGVPVRRVNRQFRYFQTVSAATMALGHGMQDAAKAAGVIVIVLVATGQHAIGDPVPTWAFVTTALAISLGTYAGGWRVVRTLGQRISQLDPGQGLAAEAATSLMLFVATALQVPISTTHSITAAIAGVGVARRRGSVRLRVARDIGWVWLLTLPGAGLIAGLAAAIWEMIAG